MSLSFKRITSSGDFIPEIDGLRFIAITSVVLFHLNDFITKKYLNNNIQNIDFSFIKNILSHGHVGVPLFFVISGFILGMPFAKYHILNGNQVNINYYFSRRLSRLEPPYILVMTVLLFGVVFIAKTLTLKSAIQSYLSSIFYFHNFIYPNHLPKLNIVAWSLEIEVQFYILAPLLALVFSINSLLKRRLILSITSIIFIIINNYNLNPFCFLSLINYLQYFLIGFLLVDIYITNSLIFPKTKINDIICYLCFISIWIFDNQYFSTSFQTFIWELIQVICIFFFYYYTLIHKFFKILSLKLITNIGGMCYSIYLLHYPIISLLGNPIVKYSFSKSYDINILIYSIILLFFILLISSVFFLLVEKPCMNKSWFKKNIQIQKNAI